MLNCNDKITVCARARSLKSSFRKINVELYLHKGSDATVLLMLKHLQRKRNLPVQKPLPARTTGIQAKTWTTPPAPPPSQDPHPPRSLLRSYFPFTQENRKWGSLSALPPGRSLGVGAVGSPPWFSAVLAGLPTAWAALLLSVPLARTQGPEGYGPTPHPAPRAASSTQRRDPSAPRPPLPPAYLALQARCSRRTPAPPPQPSAEKPQPGREGGALPGS